MKKYLKAVLIAIFLFSATTVLSYAQNAAAPSAGASTIHAAAKAKKAARHHKKAHKAHPKKQADNTVKQ